MKKCLNKSGRGHQVGKLEFHPQASHRTVRDLGHWGATLTRPSAPVILSTSVPADVFQLCSYEKDSAACQVLITAMD